MFNKITLIDKSWQIIDTIRFGVIPRANELYYSEKNKCYYNILNIIHKEGWFSTKTFIIIEKINKTEK